MDDRKTCVVTGVGPGTGSALVRRFAEGGYKVAMIARSVGPRGVHVAYVAVDAVIAAPRMRARLPDKPDDFFCRPDDIAEECFRIAHQPRSAWTFDVMIRPHAENW